LELEIPVGCEEDFEGCKRRTPQKFSVLITGPALLDDGAGIMTD
jgi:hypothetical protein